MNFHLFSRYMAATLGALVTASALLPLSAAHAEVSLRADEYVIFHHHDALGSAVATSDAEGNVLWYEHTEPFGRSLGRRDIDGDKLDTDPFDDVEEEGRSRVAYTGHVRDGASDLIYMQQRHYDPELGRFLSNDPVGFTAANTMSFNRYAYANNNPYAYVDPDGRWAVLALAIIGGGLTAYDTYDTYQTEGAGAAAKSAAAGAALTAAGAGAAKAAGSLGKRIGSFLERMTSRADVPRSTIDDKRTGHIFRNREGHLSDDTPENRSLLEDTASNPDNKLGNDRHGNVWAAETREDGSQVWTQSRDGNIINGGVNDSAREFNPETGLSATEKPSQR